MRNILSACIVIFCLAFAGLAHTYASPPQGAVPPAQSYDVSGSTSEEHLEDRSVRLLSDVSAMLEAAGVHGGDYTFRTRRQVAIDLVKLRAWFFRFDITESDLFDPSPSQIDHEFQYLGIGRETARGDRVTLFWDHTCYNPTRELPQDEQNGIHWHELGLSYTTNGMRLGHENDGIEFDSEAEWLNSFNLKASFSKVIVITENDYEYMLKFGIRDDIFRYDRHVFFAQLDLNTIYDNRGASLNPRIEVGDRINLNRYTSMTPFLSYQHFHDWYDLGDGEDFFLAGIRIEGNLGFDREANAGARTEATAGRTERERGGEDKPDQPSEQTGDSSRLPRFHVDGGYASVLGENDYGYSSDVAINLDFLEFQSNILSLDTYAGVLTPPGDLVPDFIQYKAGTSLKTDWGDSLSNTSSRMFYSYSCLYGVDHEDRIRDYSLLGLGLSNDASSLKWGAEVGYYPFTSGYDYWGELLGTASYDFRREGMVPYVGCAGQYLQGNDAVFGYAVETGMRIPGEKGDLRIYVRWQDDFNIFKFGKGRQTLLGLRLLFS